MTPTKPLRLDGNQGFTAEIAELLGALPIFRLETAKFALDDMIARRKRSLPAEGRLCALWGETLSSS